MSAKHGKREGGAEGQRERERVHYYMRTSLRGANIVRALTLVTNDWAAQVARHPSLARTLARSLSLGAPRPVRLPPSHSHTRAHTHTGTRTYYWARLFRAAVSYARHALIPSRAADHQRIVATFENRASKSDPGQRVSLPAARIPDAGMKKKECDCTRMRISGPLSGWREGRGS